MGNKNGKEVSTLKPEELSTASIEYLNFRLFGEVIFKAPLTKMMDIRSYDVVNRENICISSVWKHYSVKNIYKCIIDAKTSLGENSKEPIFKILSNSSDNPFIEEEMTKFYVWVHIYRSEIKGEIPKYENVRYDYLVPGTFITPVKEEADVYTIFEAKIPNLSSVTFGDKYIWWATFTVCCSPLKNSCMPIIVTESQFAPIALGACSSSRTEVSPSLIDYSSSLEVLKRTYDLTAHYKI
jgi:hypothetical protein